MYQAEGAYDVTLTVSNSYGSDTEKKTGASPIVTIPMATPTAAATTQAAQGTTAATTAIPQETATPGFEGILAITGLAAIIYLAKRQ